MIIKLEELDGLNIDIKPGDKIFLIGDLGSGKTTFIRSILKNQFKIKDPVRSPTYIHYSKYNDNIYHFDLYRLESYDDFINIGGEEILDDEKNTCFIEWPDLIKDLYKPNMKIIFSKKDDLNENEREVSIIVQD